MPTKSENKLHEIRNNKHGTPMEIIGYNIQSDMRIKFLDQYGYETNTTYSNFIKGQIKNPYDKTIYGVGCLGEGKYKAYMKGVHIQTKKYTAWQNMLCRCYHEKDRHLHATYEECIVCDEWLNYQNFAQWYDDNFYDVEDGKRMHIDKDILCKGGKIYSPETCIFVPQRINMLFMKKSRITDSDLPTGIRRTSTGFIAEYNTKYLGNYESLEEATTEYEKEKRMHIKELANEYRDRLPPYVYSVLLAW